MVQIARIEREREREIVTIIPGDDTDMIVTKWLICKYNTDLFILSVVIFSLSVYTYFSFML